MGEGHLATPVTNSQRKAALPERDEHSGVRLPTMADVQQAREVIAAYLPPTPMLTSPALDAKLGCGAVSS